LPLTAVTGAVLANQFIPAHVPFAAGAVNGSFDGQLDTIWVEI